MDFHNVRRTNEERRMAPLTWDPNTPLPTAAPARDSVDIDLDDGPDTRPTPTYQASDFGEDEEAFQTVVNAAVAYVVASSRVSEVAHLVAHMLRVPFDDSPVVTPLIEAPQRLEGRMFMALKRLVAAEAERNPVLIVVEDLETSGAETINLLSYL